MIMCIPHQTKPPLNWTKNILEDNIEFKKAKAYSYYDGSPPSFYPIMFFKCYNRMDILYWKQNWHFEPWMQFFIIDTWRCPRNQGMFLQQNPRLLDWMYNIYLINSCMFSSHILSTDMSPEPSADVTSLKDPCSMLNSIMNYNRITLS